MSKLRRSNWYSTQLKAKRLNLQLLMDTMDLVVFMITCFGMQT